MPATDPAVEAVAEALVLAEHGECVRDAEALVLCGIHNDGYWDGGNKHCDQFASWVSGAMVVLSAAKAASMGYQQRTEGDTPSAQALRAERIVALKDFADELERCIEPDTGDPELMDMIDVINLVRERAKTLGLNDGSL